jgi:hypothetical protein
MQALGYSEVSYTVTYFKESVYKNNTNIVVESQNGFRTFIAPSTLAYLLEKVPQTLQQNRPLIDELKKVHDYKVSALAATPEAADSITSFVLASVAAQPMTLDQPYNPNGLVGKQFTLIKQEYFTPSCERLLEKYATDFNKLKDQKEVLEETARCLVHGVHPFSDIRYDRENIKKILPSWIVSGSFLGTPADAFETFRKREQELKQLQEAIIKVLRSEGKETTVSLVEMTSILRGSDLERSQLYSNGFAPKWIGIKIGDKESLMLFQGTIVYFVE